MLIEEYYIGQQSIPSLNEITHFGVAVTVLGKSEIEIAFRGRSSSKDVEGILIMQALQIFESYEEQCRAWSHIEGR